MATLRYQIYIRRLPEGYFRAIWGQLNPRDTQWPKGLSSFPWETYEVHHGYHWATLGLPWDYLAATLGLL